MLRLFKRNNWRRDTVTEARGSCSGLSITLRNVPSLIDPETGRRKFLKVDFGHELLEELLDKHLQPHEVVRSRLRSGEPVRGKFDGLLSGIEFSISGKSVADRRERFESDVTDALIACFEAMGMEAIIKLRASLNGA